jgi:NAD+ kinase
MNLLPRYLNHVVVLSKATRWESERGNLNLDGLALTIELKRRGYPVDRIRSSHEAHTWSEHHILECLKRYPNRIGAISLRKGRRGGGITWADVKDADLVISAGGDGTLLEAASAISASNIPSSSSISITAKNTHKDSNEASSSSSGDSKENSSVMKKKSIPILAVNTDPMLSVGSLCSVRLWQTAQEAREQHGIQKNEPGTISTNNFARAEKPTGPLSSSSNLDTNGTNLLLEYGIKRVQRSSGVIVCTGTGSTAWMLSASTIPQSEIRRVLQEAVDVIQQKNLQLSPELAGSHSNSKSDEENEDIRRGVVAEVARRVQVACVFPPNSLNVQYFVREPVMNGWYGRHDTPLSSNPRRGFGRSVTLRSLGWDSAITLDGLYTYRIRYGTSAVIRVDPSNPLHAIWFHENKQTE